MSSFPEMEWAAKWDWENFMMHGSKVNEGPKKLHLTDWDMENDGEMDAGSFNLSGSGSGSGRSGPDLGNGSSTKSSISASTETSPADGMKSSGFAFETLKGRGKVSGSSPTLEASVGSVEPLICLKLGKRTYFENTCSGGNAKSPSSVIHVPSAVAVKKMKSPSTDAPTPRCQVEGCNLDLSSAKEYHKKHRVCDSHSKCPKVIVGGVERRFCQQCSRFHGLSDFDQKKRSCRRRLSDHNARRRKPQQEAIQFNSSRLPISLYDSKQQMNFVLNPRVQTRTSANSDWESRNESKFTITRAFPSKPDKSKPLSGPIQITGNQLQCAISMRDTPSNGFLALNGSTSQVLSQGFKDSEFSPNVDSAPEFRRALSLLSTTSWVSCEPETFPIDNPVHISHTAIPQTALHAISQGLPLASSEYWLNSDRQQLAYPRGHALSSNGEGNGHYESIQAFKSSYGTECYHSPLH